jgi:hypothetical protein
MFNYADELKAAVDDLVKSKKAFGVMQIKDDIKKTTKKKSSLKMRDLRLALLEAFENGNMPGYCLLSKPMVGEDGPYYVLEFTPDNPMGSLDLIEAPEIDGQQVGCLLHLYYKNMVYDIAALADCTEDTLIRSILIKCLNQISDQLK